MGAKQRQTSEAAINQRGEKSERDLIELKVGREEGGKKSAEYSLACLHFSKGSLRRLDTLKRKKGLSQVTGTRTQRHVQGPAQAPSNRNNNNNNNSNLIIQIDWGFGPSGGGQTRVCVWVLRVWARKIVSANLIDDSPIKT